MIRLFFSTAFAMSLTACASFDAAHIEGQKADAAKYQAYSDVELAKQSSVSNCFARANTDNQLATCALMGVATGMASTFSGRPTSTNIAPTTMQAIGTTAEKLAPYGAAASIAKSVSNVQSKDPVIVQQADPVVVRPEIVQPVIVQVPAQ